MAATAYSPPPIPPCSCPPGYVCTLSVNPACTAPKPVPALDGHIFAMLVLAVIVIAARARKPLGASGARGQ